jgi:hypothetical protein
MLVRCWIVQMPRAKCHELVARERFLVLFSWITVSSCIILPVFLGCQFGHLTPLLLRLWQVSNGCQMKPSATALAPNIEVADHNADNVNLFTLVRLLDFLFDSLFIKAQLLLRPIDSKCRCSMYINISEHIC